MVKRIKKKCNTCLEDKYLRDFYKRKDTPDGYRSDCRTCYKNKSNNKWFSDPEYRKRGKQRSKKHSVNKLYGLSLEEYDKIMEKPCAICGADSQALDHDHITGEVLEPLCNQCNCMLGHARESKRILELGIEYLIKHNKNSKE